MSDDGGADRAIRNAIIAFAVVEAVALAGGALGDGAVMPSRGECRAHATPADT